MAQHEGRSYLNRYSGPGTVHKLWIMIELKLCSTHSETISDRRKPPSWPWQLPTRLFLRNSQPRNVSTTMWLFQPHSGYEKYDGVLRTADQPVLRIAIKASRARIRELPLCTAVGSTYIPEEVGESCVQHFNDEARSIMSFGDQGSRKRPLCPRRDGAGARKPHRKATYNLSYLRAAE